MSAPAASAATDRTNGVNHELIGRVDVPGMRQGRQRRSQDVVVRLVRAGVELLEDGDFAGLSVERACERAGVTVGSFYARFESRDVYIDALQRIVFETIREKIEAAYAAPGLPDGDLDAFLASAVASVVKWYRGNEGFVRAMLREAGRTPEKWAPMRELGRLQVERALPVVRRISGPHWSAARERDVRMAFQMLHATLNNMAQIDPGPLSLRDRATPRRLAAAMRRLIG
jgi:AcrR family transcriptional regulator